jgi:phospholipid/cholesterol/gamma-HCH transport system substrate-binding protein
MSSEPPKQSTMSVFASPVLIGAVTVLVTLVAVFLAYGANNGLPFVPYRQLKLDLPNGDELVKGNDVREGGARIGFVTKMVPKRLRNGSVVAETTVNLQKSAGSLSVDSTAIVRTQTAIGEQYLELDQGSSKKVIPDGGTLPVAQVQSQPEFDQVLATFDRPTRTAETTNLTEFGNAFAGRGADLNVTFQNLPRTFAYLAPVAANLASPQTDLRNFFIQLDRTAGTVAPVSGTFAHTFSTMANTFEAIDASPSSLRQTIALQPSTLSVATRSLAVQRPFLDHTASFARDLSGAAVQLRATLPTLNQALVVGTRVTRRTPPLYSRLQETVSALKDLAQAPLTNAALRALTATVATVQPQVRYLGPYITVCNDWTTFWTFAAESQSTPSPGGQALRVLSNSTNNAMNSVSSGGAATPANGEQGAPGQPPEYTHAQPYGAAVTNSGKADCEYGQRGYINRSPHAPPGYNIANDPHNEVGYAAGPTYQYYDTGGGHGLGPTQVPPGQTFTREPGGNGAQLDPNQRTSP